MQPMGNNEESHGIGVQLVKTGTVGKIRNLLFSDGFLWVKKRPIFQTPHVGENAPPTNRSTQGWNLPTTA